MLTASDTLLRSLATQCGSEMMDAINDPEVLEIMLNPDGKLWVERYGRNHEPLCELSYSRGETILSLVASAQGLPLNKYNPILDKCEFPLLGARFAGAIPPVVGPGASFSIRKRANKVMTLQDYLDAGTLTAEVIAIIRSAVSARKNIVVVGGTSSGKTTFLNAVIGSIAELTPAHRLLILEDTAELQSSIPNTVFLHTHSYMIGDDFFEIDMRRLAKLCMRYAPTRIIMGEVRDAAALELLKLWNTGHPGGLGTFHADSAEEALSRLEELVEEAGVGPKQKLIGRAVDLVVYMEKTPANQRRISSVIRVHRFDHQASSYETEMLYKAV